MAFSSRNPRRSLFARGPGLILEVMKIALRSYLTAPFLALLPENWRERLSSDDSINWREAAVVSGLLQASISLAAYAAWYYYSAGHWAHRAIGVAGQAHHNSNIGTIASLPFVVIAMHPVTWVLWFFAIEGLMRTINARAMAKTSATLPLRLVERAIHFARYGEWGSAPLRDEVTRGDGTWDLKIASRRPKPHWKYPLTIRYREEFFQIHGEEHVAAARGRQHIYLLRKLPASEIVRGLEEYDTDSVLAEENPGFFATLYGEMRKKVAK